MAWPKHIRTNLRRKSPAGTLQARIFCLLRAARRPLAMSEIADDLGLPLPTTRASVWQLQLSKKVRKLGGTRYAKYELVPGATPPVDTRGLKPSSRSNLRPSSAAELLERHMEWRKRGGISGRGHGKQLPALVELANLWKPIV